MLKPPSRPRDQSGMVLLEALIGILIFTIGVLGLIGLQASTISAAADAQYRGEAAQLAEQIISQVWLNTDRTSLATLQTSINTFRYNTTGSNCAFSGGAADTTNTVLSAWVTSVTSTAATRLPGTASGMLQVGVNTASNNLVSVTVCWQSPKDPLPRQHVIMANLS